VAAMLTSFLKKEKTAEPTHRYHFRDENALAIAVELK